MSNPKEDKKPGTGASVQKQINRRNFISFGTFAVLGTAAFGGWKSLYHSTIETTGITGGAHKPLRRALNKSELFFRNFFSNNHLVKTYPKSMAAKKVRQNTNIGSDSKLDADNWRLQVKKLSGEVLLITIDQIKALPKTDLVFDFKCVEGWDQIQHWGGVRFVDFVEHFGLQPETKLNYVGMETDSAMHPQTILAYEVNDMPLPVGHGAPLRLIIPVKYGIKNLKRIGSINFSNHRPHDYWAEQGYDYYSGL